MAGPRGVNTRPGQRAAPPQDKFGGGLQPLGHARRASFALSANATYTRTIRVTAASDGRPALNDPALTRQDPERLSGACQLGATAGRSDLSSVAAVDAGNVYPIYARVNNRGNRPDTRQKGYRDHTRGAAVVDDQTDNAQSTTDVLPGCLRL